MFHIVAFSLVVEEVQNLVRALVLRMIRKLVRVIDEVVVCDGAVCLFCVALVRMMTIVPRASNKA